MFCQQCGAEMAEGAIFCTRCGAKVSDGYDDVGIGFKEFVNTYVQKTTGFESAEALLNSKVPQKFLWICFGVPAVLLFIMSIMIISTEQLSFEDIMGIFIGIIGILFLFVYPIALLVDYILGCRVTGRSHKVDRSIDADELILFLTKNLRYLYPYFNEWGYMKRVGYGIKGTVVASIQNALMGTRIGTEFGHRKSCFTEIEIYPSDSGQTLYVFNVAYKSVWSARYSCMVRSVPILQAAMEYYLNGYKAVQVGPPPQVLPFSQTDNGTQPPTYDPHGQSQMQNASMNASADKKKRKIFVFFGVAILIIFVVIIALNWNGKTDYVLTVSSHTAFVGWEYTYGEVFNQYIVSPIWEVRGEDDIHYVDISGTLKGTDYPIVITIKVVKDPNNPGFVKMPVKSVVLDGEKSPTTDDAKTFIELMFSAYDAGYKDFSSYMDDDITGLDSASSKQDLLSDETQDTFYFESDDKNNAEEVLGENIYSGEIFYDDIQDNTYQDLEGLSRFTENSLYLFAGRYESSDGTSISVSIYSSFDEGNTVGNICLYDVLNYETFATIKDENDGEGIYTLYLDDGSVMYIGFYQDSTGAYYADIEGLGAIYINVNQIETYIMTEQYIS